MKYWKNAMCLALVLFCFCFFGVAQDDPAEISFEIQETWLDESRYIQRPYFICDNGAPTPAIQAINSAISEAIPFDAYCTVLPTLAPGGRGLRIDAGCIATESFWQNAGGYVNVFVEIDGKMLQGPPSHRRYSMVFDASSGTPLSFEQLFDDPEGAKAYIEHSLDETVSPMLSTYLENDQLFPVPYDCFGFSQRGHLVLYYPHDQLSFLSGVSGAVAFRYSKLRDFMSLSPGSIAMQFLEDSSQYGTGMNEAAFSAYFAKYGDTLPGLDLLLDTPAPALGAALDTISGIVTDSDYYPGGALFETEHPLLRGTFLITDPDEARLTAILSSRIDMYGIETGTTLLEDAKQRLGISMTGISIDAETADLYHVCPGSAVSRTYPLSLSLSNRLSASSVTMTLYADEADVIRFCMLSLDE